MRPLIFRPSSGVIVTVLVWVVAAVIIGSLVAVGSGPGAELWPIAPVAVAVAWLTWVLLWWPRVRLAGEGIEVRNPFRTTRIPWTDLDEVDARGTLVLSTPAGPVKAWAAPPAVNRLRRRADAIARIRGRGGQTTASARVRNDDPNVAEAIERSRDGRHRLPSTADPYPSVSTSWNIAVLIVSVVVVAVAVVRLFV